MSNVWCFLRSAERRDIPYQSPIFNIILSSEVNDHRRPKLVNTLKKKTSFLFKKISGKYYVVDKRFIKIKNLLCQLIIFHVLRSK